MWAKRGAARRAAAAHSGSAELHHKSSQRRAAFVYSASSSLAFYYLLQTPITGLWAAEGFLARLPGCLQRRWHSHTLPIEV